MHHFGYIGIINESSGGVFGTITTLATLSALFFAIYQSVLARRSLDAAKKAIDEDKRARQLSMIPKMSWVIEVQIRIEAWLKDLEEIKIKTFQATVDRNEDMLKSIAAMAPTHPNKINMALHVFHEKMPDALKEIMMSGAQYYYNAMSPASCLWTKKGANWDFASSIQERYSESIFALQNLQSLISEMVPDVLLNTPASINDGDFFKK